MKSRRERREEARKNKEQFTPQYNQAERLDLKGNKIIVGGQPKTFEEAYGIGYERFNTKYVTIKEVEVEVE